MKQQITTDRNEKMHYDDSMDHEISGCYDETGTLLGHDKCVHAGQPHEEPQERPETPHDPIAESITKAQQAAALLHGDIAEAHCYALNAVTEANAGPIPASHQENALLAYLGERLEEARRLEAKLLAL